VTQPPGGAAPPPQSTKQALYQALEGAVKSEHEKRAQDAAARKRTRRAVSPLIVLSLLMLFGVGGYLAVTQPEWLFPQPAHAESLELRDASLRMVMYMEWRRIDQFRASAGRLPVSLTEVGVEPEGVSYRRLSASTWMMEGVNGSLRVTLRSTDTAQVFLGNAFEILSRRGQR
jgi:hypothetical protein